MAKIDAGVCTWEDTREDGEFEASLGYTETQSQKSRPKQTKQEEENGQNGT
jgi:hypothetical protein